VEMTAAVEVENLTPEGGPLSGPRGRVGAPPRTPRAPRPRPFEGERWNDHPARDAALAAGRASRRVRIREAAEARAAAPLPPSLPKGVFAPGVDAPERPDVIYTIAGYVSLGYAAALFGVPLSRLEDAVWKGHLPGIKSDESRNAPWMVSFRDVTAYLGRNPPRGRVGRPPGAKNRTPEERAQEAQQAAAVRERWGPRTDDQRGADGAAAG
jgi:hypothetical protein